MNYIKRHIEDILKDRFENAKCTLITGARQVGKSTLALKVFNNINTITLDDLIIRDYANSDPKLFISSLKKPSFIDEVQYAENIFPYIKIECDKAQNNGNFLLTGSQQMKLMKKARESLAGRISILELQSLSLREMNNVDFNTHFVPNENYLSQREKHLKKYDNIFSTIHRGMYPEINIAKRNWSDFYSSYVKGTPKNYR